jgi:hypothetical protein
LCSERDGPTLCKLVWLVVSTNPSQKSWSSSVGMIFPNWMESHKIHVPNHQPVSKAMVLGIPPSKTSLRSGPGLLMSRHGHHQGSRTRSWTSAVSCVPCSFKGNIYVTCCYYLLLWFQKGRSRVNHRTMWADIWYAEETSTRTSEVFICVPSFSCDSSYSILRHLESRTFKVRSSMLQLSRRPPTVRVDELGQIRVAGLPRYVYMTEIWPM